MRKVIERQIVKHPVLGDMIKYYEVTYNNQNEVIEKQFWGYDEIGVNNGGLQEVQFVNNNNN